jgi:hypothetical protein
MSSENQAAIELSEQELDVVAGGNEASIISKTLFEQITSAQFAFSESNAKGSRNFGLNLGDEINTKGLLEIFQKQ